MEVQVFNRRPAFAEGVLVRLCHNANELSSLVLEALIIAAHDADCPILWRLSSAQQVNDRRFARAGWPNEAKNLSLLDRQREGPDLLMTRAMDCKCEDSILCGSPPRFSSLEHVVPLSLAAHHSACG